VNLNTQYVKRQNEIYSSYHKLETDYESDKAAYEKTLREYNNCRSASPFSSPLLSLPQQSITGLSSPVVPTQSNCGLAPTAPKPPVPPPKVSVEPAWVSEAETIQEEASAVREELNHRLGRHPSFFVVPRSYDYKPSALDMAGCAKALEDTANKLH
jgi:hypothetical protein